jgi:hypothetical protein
VLVVGNEATFEEVVPETTHGEVPWVVVTVPEMDWVSWKKVPVTAWLAGKLLTETVPETGCVAWKKVPVTAWVAGKLLTVTEPEMG